MKLITSGVFIVDFEQVNVGQDSNYTKSLNFV